MSVRKRAWITRRGESREAWIVDYTDQQGGRHIQTFNRKKDADAYEATVRVDVSQGVHTAPSKSLTISQAAADWLAYVEGEGRERTTIEQYRQHVDSHIVPRIGATKLSGLTTPGVEMFRDDLLKTLSRSMAKKVLGSLKSLLKDAKRRGNVAQNVARDTTIAIPKRSKRKLRAGADFPLPIEVRAILDRAQGRRRAILIVLAFAGLRASELRGLRRKDVDPKTSEIHVRQRADRYGVIGPPKSEAGERDVPIGPMVLNTLRPLLKGDQASLVFGTGTGNAENHSNLVQRILHCVQVEAGIVAKDGAPKYTGLHCLRHFYASWLINRRQNGGLELPLKEVQTRLGHATLAMTADTYGHLFPPHVDHTAEIAAAEQALFAATG
jgi:integrase